MEGYGFSNSNRGFLAEPDGLKHEDVLSNCLKRWLDGSRSLVVNREVQLIEIMHHRLDLKIDIPGEAPLCTIVEVKKDENIEAPGLSHAATQVPGPDHRAAAAGQRRRLVAARGRCSLR